MKALITGLAYRLGELTPLTQLVGHGLTAEDAEKLLDRGQRMCAVASHEEPLIAGTVNESFASSGIAAADVDRVLFTTESIVVSGSKRDHEMARARLHLTLAELGLGHAPVAMMTFAGCSVVVAAIEYAALLVDREIATNVLVVAVDRVFEGQQRVLPPAVSVVGDAAASCVVRSGGNTNDGIRPRWIRRRAFLEVAKHERRTNFGPALVMLGRSLGALARDIRADSNILDRAWLLCNNYGLPTLRLMGRTLGIDDDRLFVRNVPAIGHLGSPDALVNLATVPSTYRELIVLATGPSDCALAFFERENANGDTHGNG